MGNDWYWNPANPMYWTVGPGSHMLTPDQVGSPPGNEISDGVFLAGLAIVVLIGLVFWAILRLTDR